jgi:hypothetical protein
MRPPLDVRDQEMSQTAAAAPDRSEQIVRASFARFDIRGLATATGVVLGVLVCLSTLALWLQGAAGDSNAVPQLHVIASVYPGYSVSLAGAIVGLLYGFITGFAIGAAIGFSWNLVHFMFVMRATGRYGTGGDL